MDAEVDGTQPRLSRDGRKVAFTRLDPGSGARDIWIADLNQRNSMRATFTADTKGFPLWSSDGRRILFMRRTGNIGNLLEKDASGVGEERLLRTGPTILYDLSPDGGLALVGSSVGLQLVPVDGKEEPVPLAPESSISLHGRFSPDGRHIAYTSGETGRREIYVRAVPPASGKWQISSGGGGYPVWRRDGRELFYVSLDARMMSVDVIAGAVFRWGVPRTLFSGAPSSEQMGPLNGSYDVTADGQRFLFFERADEGSDSSLVVVQNWFAGLKR